MIQQIEALPVTAVELRSATRSDVILSKVLRYTKSGWPVSVPDSLKPYFYRRNELTLEEDCVLWGARVVVPKKLQERVLEELHTIHIWESPKLKLWQEVMFGGRNSILQLNHWYILVLTVRLIRLLLKLHLSTHGYGRVDLGSAFMSILLAPFKVELS